MTIEGVHYGKIDANMERRTGRNQWIEVTLTEGKNREVRRVLEAIGLTVNRLIRLSYGPFQLGVLGQGQVEEVGPRVIREQLVEYAQGRLHPAAGAESGPGAAHAGTGRRGAAGRNQAQDGL